MTIRLDALGLNPAELAAAQDIIRRMAYYNWLDFRCPEGRALDCWVSAEREWIERDYVPSRPLNGMRLPCLAVSSSSTTGDGVINAEQD